MLIAYSRCSVLTGSVAARSLLVKLLGIGYNLELPDIAKTQNGKPYFPKLPNVHFSIAHTKTHALCVVSDVPVGCDIEAYRTPRRGLPEYFCSASELEQFSWLELWVLKESYIKLTDGKLGQVRRIRFSRDGGTILSPESGAEGYLLKEVPGCEAGFVVWRGQARRPDPYTVYNF